jgi:hypothetical protein
MRGEMKAGKLKKDDLLIKQARAEDWSWSVFDNYFSPNTCGGVFRYLFIFCEN